MVSHALHASFAALSRQTPRAFETDARSLALLRVGLGLTIIADLWIRAQDLGAHYTDAGVLSRGALADEVRSRLPWAAVLLQLQPHFLFGGSAGQSVLFLLAGIVAVLLIVGWRTRWVTVASWVLLASLQGRNPAVLNTGDVVLRLLLFWSMFLPLGTRWSLDARREGDGSGDRVRGGGAAALLLQVAFIYVFTAIFKTGAAAWTTDYTALEMALGGTWASAWGERLLQYPELLNLMTRFTIGLERFGPVLLFIPFLNGPARTLAVVLFVAFHIGILLWMSIPIFAVACVVAWLAVLPTWFWNMLSGSNDRRVSGSVRPPRWQGAVALAIIGYVFLWNVQTVGGWNPPRIFHAPAYLLRVDQRWAMFSPEPPSRARYLAAFGETADGTTVDLLNGTPAGDPRPATGRYGRERWRNYFGYLAGRAALGERLAIYLDQRWSGPRLTSVRILTIYETLGRPAAHGQTGDRFIQELARVSRGGEGS